MMSRAFLSLSLCISLLISLLPAPTQASELKVSDLFFASGAGLVTVGLIKINRDKTASGATLMIIGAGIAAASKPDQTRQLFDSLVGKTTTDRVLQGCSANFKAFCEWLPKV